MVLSQSRLTLYWLLTLDVRLPKGCSGMVPMTSGSSRSSLDVPGISTQTCRVRRQQGSCWCFPSLEGQIPPQSTGSSWPRGNSCSGMQREMQMLLHEPSGCAQAARGHGESSRSCTGGAQDLLQITSPKISAPAQSQQHSSGEKGKMLNAELNCLHCSPRGPSPSGSIPPG